MFKKRMKRFSAFWLSMLLLITSIPMGTFASEQNAGRSASEGASKAGSFVFAAFSQNDTVVEPVRISYKAGDTVKDALEESDITFGGLETGFIQSVEGVSGNYSMVFYDGGYGIDKAADQVKTFFLSERTDVIRTEEPEEGKIPDDIVTAVSEALLKMTEYNEAENNVQNYAPAQDAYKLLLTNMRTADKDTLNSKTAELEEKIGDYNKYLNGNKRTVTVHVTQGGKDVTDAKLAFKDQYGNVTEAVGNTIELLDGKYVYVVTDSHKPYNSTTNVGKMNQPGSTSGGWNTIENYFEVSEASKEVSVKLASGEWFGDITVSAKGSEALYKNKTENDAENHKIICYVADCYKGTILVKMAKAAGTPVNTNDGTLSSVNIRPWVDFVYGTGKNAGRRASDMATSANTNMCSFGSEKTNSNVLAYGMEGNTMDLDIRWLDDQESDATGGIVMQSYDLEIKRLPTLSSMVVKDRAGSSILYDFDPYTGNYEISTTDDQFVIDTVAYNKDYNVTVKAGDHVQVNGNQVTLEGEDGTFTVTVTSGEAKNDYTVQLNKVVPVTVTLNLPENVTAEVYNANESKIEAKKDGGTEYALVPGEAYTYIATQEEEYHTTAAFTAADQLTVSVAAPEVKEILTDFVMYDGNSKKTRKEYEFDRSFLSTKHDYTVKASDMNSGLYVQANKSDTKYNYYVKYLQQNNTSLYGDVWKDWTKQNITYSVNADNGVQPIARVLAASGQSNLFRLRVQKTVSNVTYYQEYRFDMVRDLHIKELTLSKSSSEEISFMDEENKGLSFDREIFKYIAKVSADTQELSLSLSFPNEADTYSFDGGYYAEVNGSRYEEVKDIKIPLDVNLEEETLMIKVCHKDPKAISNTYTIVIKKQQPIAVAFKTTPETASIFITNTIDNKNIYANEDGIFYLMPEIKYDYVITAPGYQSVENAAYTLQESPSEITETIVLKEAPEATEDLPDYKAQWPTFRADFNGNGVVSAKTPTESEDTVLYWANKIGQGFDSDASGCPILVNGYLYTYAGDQILKVDTTSGEVLARKEMAGKSSFAINSPTYANGMIFVGLGDGKVQAFNAETLNSLWVYTDPLGGQPNCSIKYQDGYIYTGFWSGETKKANFVCISVTDEDPTQPQEEKLASWRYTHNGFYWAGAYASKKYVLVGTDDGEAGYTTGHASVLSFDPVTGKLLDEKVLPGVGDLRSDIMYDQEGTGDYYFTTKGGDFYRLSVNENGTFKNLKQLKLYNYANDQANPAMSTCTPVVYKGRAYIGVSGTGQFSAYSGHNITVIDLNTWSIAYTVRTQGYPQTSGLLTTAYEETTGLVYVYFIDNFTPGKLRVIADKADQREPIEVTQEAGYDVAPVLFTPYDSQAQYAICSPIADADGFMYFKNDSAHMMCVGPALTKLEVTRQPEKTLYEVGDTFQPGNMQVTAVYSNGATKDVTKYVTYSTKALTAEDTELLIEFPYVMYQNKDGQIGVEYTAPTASISLTVASNLEDAAAADQVKRQIVALGEVTLESEAAIEEARQAYDGLNVEQKALIPAEILKILTDAEATLVQLKADAEAAKVVTEKINGIGEVTLESETKITEARSAYEAMTETQKTLILEETLKVLTDAEAALAQLKADAKAAEALTEKINGIGEVTLESETKITEARNAYNSLNDRAKAQITEETLEILTNAEETLARLKADQAAAETVTEKINGIGEVTLESETKITEARSAYEAMTETQKALILEETLKVLTNAEAALAQLKADAKAAEAVTEKINGIGEVTLESETKIAEARNAYNSLNDRAKAQITEETLEILTNAEEKLAQLKKDASDQELAAAVENAINEIGEVTLEKEGTIQAVRESYKALTEDQKAYISAEVLAILSDAETVLEGLKKEKADQAAAQAVTEKINAIGEATLSSETVIAEARNAYNTLTEDQKAYITEEILSVLTDAEAKLEQLKKEKEEKEKTDQAAAQAVIEKINGIGEVTLSSEAAIKEARNAYDALTEDQKAYISVESIVALTDAEAKLIQLKKEQAEKEEQAAFEDQNKQDNQEQKEEQKKTEPTENKKEQTSSQPSKVTPAATGDNNHLGMVWMIAAIGMLAVCLTLKKSGQN